MSLKRINFGNLCLWSIFVGTFFVFTGCETTPEVGASFEKKSVVVTNPKIEAKSDGNSRFLGTRKLPDGPYLRLNSTGHVSRPMDVAFSSNDKEIYTTGLDKVIHVWKASNGKWLRTLRTPIDQGRQGGHLTIAVARQQTSHGADIIAVGGYGLDKIAYPIWLLDSNTGRILAAVEGHHAPITTLEFSNDGRYLASGSMDRGVRIWKFQPDKDPSQKLAPADKVYPELFGFQGSVKDLAWNQDGSELLVVADLGAPRVYSLKNGMTDEPRGQDIKFKSELAEPSWDQVEICGERFFLVSTTGQLYSGSNSEKYVTKKIQLGSGNNRIGPISAKDDLLSVQWIRNGDQVDLFDQNSIQVLILDTRNDEEAIIRNLNHPDNLLASLAWAGNGAELAGLGGTSPDLLKWDLSKGSEDKWVFWNALSAGNPVGKLDLQLVGETAYLKITPMKSPIPERSKVQEPLLMDLRVLEPLWDQSTIAQVSGGSIRRLEGRQINVKDGVLYFVKPGEREPWSPVEKNDYVRSASFVGPGRVAIATSTGLYLTTENGELLQEIHDHEGETLEVVSDLYDAEKNIRLVASGGQDGVVNIYQLNSGYLIKKLSIYYEVNAVSGQQEWVIWLPNGTYKSSPGGASLFGWHVNHGMYEKPDFYMAYQFQRLMDNPETVENVLGNLDPIPENLDIIAYQPPSVTPRSMSNYLIRKGEKSVKAKFEIDSKNLKPTNVVAMVNGAYIDEFDSGDLEFDDRSGKYFINFDVPVDQLTSGDNKITVSAINEAGVYSQPSDDSSMRLTYNPDVERPAKIFGLFIGYDGPEGEGHLDFAEQDALEVAKSWEQDCGIEIELISLLGEGSQEDASLDSILNAFHQLRKKVTPEDVVVVFLSGHGMRDGQQQFYFETTDIEKEWREYSPKDLRSFVKEGTGLKWTQLLSELRTISGRKILLMNSCRSGSATGMGAKGEMVYQWTSRDARILQDLYDPRNGIVAIAARGPGKGDVIQEKAELGGSAFAKAIISAVTEVDSEVSSSDEDVFELYCSTLYSKISSLTRKLTDNQQRPPLFWPNMMEDFPAKSFKYGR